MARKPTNATSSASEPTSTAATPPSQDGTATNQGETQPVSAAGQAQTDAANTTQAAQSPAPVEPTKPPEPSEDKPEDKAEVSLVEVAVLRDCWIGMADTVVTLLVTEAKAAARDGAVDLHPSAVAALKAARPAQQGSDAIED